MRRRQFMAGSLLAGAAAHGAIAEQTAKDQPVETPAFITSEVGKLRRVIVHPPGDEIFKVFPFLLGNHSMLTWELLRPEVATQHAGLVAALKHNGVEVLLVEELLNAAIEEARRTEKLAGWLSIAAPALGDQHEKLTADRLLGSRDEVVYGAGLAGVALRPAVRPTTTMFFTRDLAVMTPRGVILSNFNNNVRSWEASLMRFMFEHAPQLAKYPIVFDAAEEGVFLEGGDVMVFDEKTLLVGIGGATQEQAAVKLAQKLDMNVLAVDMPRVAGKPGEWDGLQTLFYHLDCLVNFVGQRQVLAVPYLIEKEQTGGNALLDVLYGIARIENYDKAARLTLLEQVRSVGWLRRYKAGTGERDASIGAVKLLDWLRGEGFAVTYVGGERAKENSLKHAIEHVLRECRFLAVNIVALGDKHVLAYDGNDRTIAALRAAGVEVTTFAASELMRANGGPHCLTLPLERT